MKITICGSLNFSNNLIKISNELKKLGHDTDLPFYTMKILNGEMTEDNIRKEKENGDEKLRERANVDLIKRYYKKINNSDTILVCNYDKNKIKNYIGGNTFLEMGFAYVLDKPIYLLNNTPEMLYKDEIIAMNPIIIYGNLNKINNF